MYKYTQIYYQTVEATLILRECSYYFLTCTLIYRDKSQPSNDTVPSKGLPRAEHILDEAFLELSDICLYRVRISCRQTMRYVGKCSQRADRNRKIRVNKIDFDILHDIRSAIIQRYGNKIAEKNTVYRARKCACLVEFLA